MTKSSNKLKKSCFWSIFPILCAKNVLLENLVLSRTTSHGILAPCQNLEKINDAIPRKHPDRRKDGQKDWRKDRRTLFYRTLPATAGDPINWDLFLPNSPHRLVVHIPENQNVTGKNLSKNRGGIPTIGCMIFHGKESL